MATCEAHNGRKPWTTFGARVLLAAITVLAVSSPLPARADWAYTRWGMTPEQVAAASSGAVKVLPAAQRIRQDVDHSELAAEGTYRDGALDLHVGFSFDSRSGGLTCVMYNVKGDDAAKLKAVLLARYGKPHHEGSYGRAEMADWITPDKVEFAAGQNPVAAAVSHCAP